MKIKSKKSEKELVNEILISKRKVQIRALYSSAELESKRTNLKTRKMTSRSNAMPKPVKVKLALKSQIRESPKPKQVKQTKKVAPDKSSEKKSIVLKNPQPAVETPAPTKSHNDEGKTDEESLETEPRASELFRKTFHMEIQKVEMNVKTKFELLSQSKDKELREEREKSSNLQNDKEKLQKDIDDRNLKLENLKKVIFNYRECFLIKFVAQSI